MRQQLAVPDPAAETTTSFDFSARESLLNKTVGAALPTDPKNEVPAESLDTPLEMFGQKSGQIVSRKSTQSSESASIILKDLTDFIPTQLRNLDDALLELNLHVGSAHLRYAAEQSAIAAESTLPILLTGETGTGKERFAHLIHRLSPRASKYIVPVNCAAIPESLAETYLFGHTKGAFSGATADKAGLFENADGSTLFLDEIAELSLDIQAKLLRVIQDGVIQRIGSPRSRQVDVRIVAATNRDLKKEVEGKRFREDLYFRLEVVQIRLPALRDRRAEIPELALNLLKQINQRRQHPRQLSKEALLALEGSPWPGNVRQLSNVLERSVLYSRSEVLQPGDLLLHDGSNHCQPPAFLPEPAPGFSIEDFLDKARKQLFLSALKKCNNNQAEAAALLGVSKQAVSKFVASLDDNHD
jgi:Nif-specific regulatory protein